MKETLEQFKARALRKKLSGWRLMRARDRWDQANSQGICHPSHPDATKTTTGPSLESVGNETAENIIPEWFICCNDNRVITRALAPTAERALEIAHLAGFHHAKFALPTDSKLSIANLRESMRRWHWKRYFQCLRAAAAPTSHPDAVNSARLAARHRILAQSLEKYPKNAPR